MGTCFRFLPVVAALALLALAPSALADSIVYEKDGNIWEARPDGSGQRQITSGGGYTKPTQADNGTILAFKAKLLHRMDRAGRLLNTAADPDNTNVSPLTPHVSPDGTRVVYNLNYNGPILFGPYVATSYANRETARSEIDDAMSGYLNPTWIDNGRAVIFPTGAQDTQIWTIPGNVEDWFVDSGVDLSGGEVDASLTRFASAADSGSIIRLYALPGPPPALPDPRCDITDFNPPFFRPTWSPTGASLAWEAADGIRVGTFSLGDCSGSQSLVIPGGKAPDWGPADVSPPGSGGSGSGGQGGGSTVARPAVSFSLAGRLARLLKALNRGVAFNVRTDRSGQANVQLLGTGRNAARTTVVARGSRRLPGAGRYKVVAKFTRKAKRKFRRMRRVTLTARVTVRAAGGGTTTKRRRITLRR